MANQQNIAKQEVRKNFEEMKTYLETFINKVVEVKQDNNGVLPDEYVQAVTTVRERLDKFKELQTRLY